MYFDPDSVAVYTEPVPPVKPVDEPPLKRVEPSQVRKAREARNERKEYIYYELRNHFRYDEEAWEKYLDMDAKLRERIQSTVAPHKKASLPTTYSVRQSLIELRKSTALPVETIRQKIQTEYQKFMGVALHDWPSRGPTNWLAEWEFLINLATRYEEPLPSWLSDICLVWERVSDLAFYFSDVQISIQKNDTAEYTPVSVIRAIEFYWVRHKQRSELRVASKPKATRSAVSTQDVTLNGAKARSDRSRRHFTRRGRRSRSPRPNRAAKRAQRHKGRA
ncbi:hypothetical protein MMC29_004167 [Sticta canariensis]|nr:hypothetical protein [Sticta canariensis]